MDAGSGLASLNRTQLLVLAFLAAVWVTAITILGLAPRVFDQVLTRSFANRRPSEIAFVAILSLFLSVLATGAVRRWRWTFWLMLLAFLAGILRPPATALELSGIVRMQGPTWYVALQGVVGVVQFAIGIAMVRGFRRGGPWASF